jgi:hypothetical protein
MRREELAILRFDPSSRAVWSNRPERTYPTSADWSFVTGSKASPSGPTYARAQTPV